MTLLETAIALAESGIRVFPLVPKAKNPISSRGVKDATTNLDSINTWWKKWPDANIGIAMGKESGILGIDIDYKDGCRSDFLKSLPSTIVTVTPTGGHHAFFKYDARVKNGLKLEVGATIRSDGYYFVGPLSVHPLGGEYKFYQNGHGSKFTLWDGEIAELPEWVFNITPETEFKQKARETGVGGRHEKLKAIATAMRINGKSKEETLAGLLKANEEFKGGPKGIEEVYKIIEWCFKVIDDNQIKEKTEEKKKKEKKKDPSPYALANRFLNDCGFYDSQGRCLLKYYQQDFYRYKEGYYQKLDDEWVEDKLNRWLVGAGFEHIAGTKNVVAIFKMLKTRPVYVPSQIGVPCLLRNGEWYKANHLIPMKNGLFNIKKYIDTGEKELIPHNPDYFCKNKLGFDYDDSAKCTVYDQICADIFSGEEEINCWNEVVGVHLYCPFLIENFFILEGEGANGKSVLRTILTCLLGRENVSSVPIECFNPSSFAFINTLGKLANIIPDMKDVTDIDEGALKAFVSREEMSFNRKGKPFVDAKPTAFLTICTNVLPRFNDKSDGIWRRIILFKLEKSVPEEKQNPQFREFDFWESGEELSGIFNKALLSLKNVVKNGRISVPQKNQLELDKYKKELNIIHHFAEAHLEYVPFGRAAVMDVYEEYKKFAAKYGGKSFGKISFDKQLKSIFKKMGKEIDLEKQRPSALLGGVGGNATWHWINLNLFKEG